MFTKIKKFFKEEVGAETMEYVAIAAVVIIIGAGAYTSGGIDDIITEGLEDIGDVITNAQPAAGGQAAEMRMLVSTKKQ